MVISATKFSNREELEKHIAVTTGITLEDKADYAIVGTAEELKKLHLSHGKKCWGIAVTATDSYKKLEGKTSRVNRGKVFKPKAAPSVDIKSSKER